MYNPVCHYIKTGLPNKIQTPRWFIVSVAVPSSSGYNFDCKDK